jgi:hypothetical protein
MTKAGRSFTLAATLLVLTSATLCQDKSQESFENQLYSIAEIKHFGLDPQQFAALSDSDKKKSSRGPRRSHRAIAGHRDEFFHHTLRNS